MVCVAILGIALATGVPALAAMIDGMKVRTASYAFIGSMQLARTEAMRRGSRVAMCKSRDGSGCTADGGWQQGWLVFHDPNRNGRPDDGEAVIERHPGYPGKLVFTGNQPTAQIITYSPLGPPRTVVGALLAGTLTVCNRSADPVQARQIVISRTGRVRMQEVTVPACG